MSLESMPELYTFIEGPTPDLSQVTPIQALKDYIRDCGGDSDFAIGHFLPPPPPVVGVRHAPKKRPLRSIASSVYATSSEGHEPVSTLLLCCWDDPCVRENCPYRHASLMKEQHPDGDWWTLGVTLGHGRTHS